jgi:hypothetical protein
MMKQFHSIEMKQNVIGNISGLTITPTAPPPPVEPSAPPPTPTAGTPEFHMWMYQYEDKSPSYWSIFGPSKSLKEWNSQGKQDKYKIVKVTPQEENAVSKMVQETWLSHYIGKGRDGIGLEDLQYTNIKVINVERIENTELFEKYSQTRSKLFLKAGILEKPFTQLQDIPVGTKRRTIFTAAKADRKIFTDIYPEINEHYLFHGTQDERIPTIAAQGFDIRLNDKTMFGAAIYAAESSTKSDQYAGKRTYGNHFNNLKFKFYNIL